MSAEEKAKVSRLSSLSEQFVAADKYVFVTPLWGFSFPPVMKAYFDSVSVAGKTFKYTEEGPVGLLTDKKAFHIQARGGFYSEEYLHRDLEMGHRYISVMMNSMEFLLLRVYLLKGIMPCPIRHRKSKKMR